ncbi:hypothetical protein GQ457_09G029070 [Hibiscus cannabinus]
MESYVLRVDSNIAVSSKQLESNFRIGFSHKQTRASGLFSFLFQWLQLEFVIVFQRQMSSFNFLHLRPRISAFCSFVKPLDNVGKRDFDVFRVLAVEQIVSHFGLELDGLVCGRSYLEKLFANLWGCRFNFFNVETYKWNFSYISERISVKVP